MSPRKRTRYTKAQQTTRHVNKARERLGLPPLPLPPKRTRPGRPRGTGGTWWERMGRLLGME